MRILKNGKKEEGQTLVEFALVLPILLMLALGAIEFGWVLFARISAINGAREGARTYAVNKDSGTAKSAAVNAMPALGFVASNVQTSTIAGPPFPQAVVEVNGNINTLIGLYLPPQVSIHAKAVMRIEYE